VTPHGGANNPDLCVVITTLTVLVVLTTKV